MSALLGAMGGTIPGLEGLTTSLNSAIATVTSMQSQFDQVKGAMADLPKAAETLTTNVQTQVQTTLDTATEAAVAKSTEAAKAAAQQAIEQGGALQAQADGVIDGTIGDAEGLIDGAEGAVDEFGIPSEEGMVMEGGRRRRVSRKNFRRNTYKRRPYYRSVIQKKTRHKKVLTRRR
jgi:hypothetical protein